MSWNFYDWMMKPLEDKWLRQYRIQLLSHAVGDALEIGYGTGANFPFYDAQKVLKLVALDTEPLPESGSKGAIPVERILGSAEELPFSDASFDTVVETLVLCSVQDLEKSLKEVKRVLKPGGSFIFMDHVLPEIPWMQRVFKGANHVWPHVAHGCQLTREPRKMIEALGFQLLESGSFGKTVFNYGIAIGNE